MPDVQIAETSMAAAVATDGSDPSLRLAEAGLAAAVEGSTDDPVLDIAGLSLAVAVEVDAAFFLIGGQRTYLSSPIL